MDWMLIVTAIGVIVIPFVGWIFNSLITKKIDDQYENIKNLKNELEMEKENSSSKNKQLSETIFNRLDDLKKMANETYVRQDLYKQNLEFQTREVDQKFSNILAITSANFKSIEDKLDSIKSDFKDMKFSKNDK